MDAVNETDASTPERLELTGQIPGSPAEVYQAFVNPAVLTAWWPDEADVDPVVGGSYVVRWPAMEWTLRGAFTELVPNRTIGFTWSWDHEPAVPTRTVLVTLLPSGGGTRLTLAHGEYGPADADERQGHLDGWQFFLGRLCELYGP